MRDLLVVERAARLGRDLTAVYKGFLPSPLVIKKKKNKEKVYSSLQFAGTLVQLVRVRGPAGLRSTVGLWPYP